MTHLLAWRRAVWGARCVGGGEPGGGSTRPRKTNETWAAWAKRPRKLDGPPRPCGLEMEGEVVAVSLEYTFANKKHNNKETPSTSVGLGCWAKNQLG
jgi:hypothetical protein